MEHMLNKKTVSFSSVLEKLKLFLLTGVLVIVAGCQSNIGSGTYSASQAGQAERTEPGIILAYRYVEVKDEGSSDGGMLLGAIAGGVLGSMVGGGRGNTLATLGGVAAGGAMGSSVGDSMGTQEGIEYTIEESNGRIVTMVQGPEPLLQVGDHVLIQYSSTGRGRVILDPRY